MYQGTIIIKILEESCVQDYMPCDNTVKIQYFQPERKQKVQESIDGNRLIKIYQWNRINSNTIL